MAGLIYQMSEKFHDDGPGCPIRRLRRAPHISEEQVLIYYPWMQVDVEVGLGLDGAVQGSDPQMLMRYSDDGGKTWSNSRQGSVGKAGEYSRRVRWRRLGRGRDRVFEIVTSDPIPYRIVDAYLQVEGGSH